MGYYKQQSFGSQNMQDWILGLGVLVFVIIDLILLFLNITIGEALGASTAVLVPNRDNPRTCLLYTSDAADE